MCSRVRDAPDVCYTSSDGDNAVKFMSRALGTGLFTEITMADKNKNQTAQERARLRETVGSQGSGRFCASRSCPTKAEPILKKDLYPVVMAYPRRTVFYHRSCTAGLS